MLTGISTILWIVTTLFITLSGLYLSFYLRFGHMKLTNIVNKNAFKLLNVSLAGKIGVGSISGIAISILIGGKGTIFWIWISSIILGIITYSEAKLGATIGSPKKYIKENLNKKRLSKLYSILIVFIYLISFILIQSNTIIISLQHTFHFNRLLILIFLIIIVIISINKDIERISNIVSIIVPIMGFLYIVIGLIVILNNIVMIPTIIKDILKESISIKSLISLPIIVGFQRAIFSTEAGTGTTSTLLSISKSKAKEEITMQVIGTYFITLVICTISAFIILTSNYDSLNITNINGIEIVIYAFNYHFKEIGIIILSIITFLFAYSTIITSYFYAKENINTNNKTMVKIIVIIILILSNFVNPNIIWTLTDILSSLVTLINVYAIIKLRRYLRCNYDRK
ncbi:MAG: sodium:alanine symporter family protein [Bacilli bacterium]|nr:sodium:alanine symporter family protein [Bacilli bacterium]